MFLMKYKYYIFKTITLKKFEWCHQCHPSKMTKRQQQKLLYLLIGKDVSKLSILINRLVQNIIFILTKISLNSFSFMCDAFCFKKSKTNT